MKISMKLKKIGVFLLGTAIGGVIISFSTMKTITQAKKNEKKYLTLFRMMNQYLVTKQLDKKLEDFFVNKGIETIAIYGMSHVGQRIIDDLENSRIKIMYGIDQRADKLTYDMDIYSPEDELPVVDAIVVTAYDFDEIVELLEGKVNCKILAFDEIIFNL